MGEAVRRGTFGERKSAAEEIARAARKLKISVHEFETPEGKFVGMNAGEYTGVFAPYPIDDETHAGMQAEVQRRAEHLLSLHIGADLPEGCDMSLDEIKASIRDNIVSEEPVDQVLIYE